MSTELLDLLVPEHPYAVHPDLPGVKAFFMPIGPAMADKILSGYRPDYRGYLESHGALLTEAMVKSQWVFDGSPIRVLADGSFADGQHRMRAIKSSGKTHIFLIVMGLDPEAYDSMDTGAIRKYENSLVRRGYTKNAPLLSLFIQMIYRWENSRPLMSEGKITFPDLDKTLEKHETEIMRCIELTVGGSKRIRMSPALVAFCWWIFRQVDLEKAHTFMSQVAYGEHIGRGDPAYTLKLKLDDIWAETKISKLNRFNRHHYTRFAFQAFNAFDADIPLTTLIKGDGSLSSIIGEKINPLIVHANRIKGLQEKENA